MVHQYKLNGYNIVLDVFSNSVYLVDEIAYDVISLFKDLTEQEIIEKTLEKYDSISKGDIEETISDIKELEKNGTLFSEDIYADKAFDFKNRSTDIKALCLHIAHTCNLACEYCFAGQGKYHGNDALMSLETGKRAIDFLIENSGNRKNLEVDFFGGEPLMNWEVVKDIVKYAREIEGKHNKNFRFTLTTNGVLVDDDVIEFANREMHNVVLSLDGRREVHDRLRKTPNGKGSYDTILPKFQKFVKTRAGKGYYMRGTFTHNNLDFTNDILHMADLGFHELSMEPVVCSPDDPCAITEADLPKVFEQYEILANEMQKRRGTDDEFTFYHYMINLAEGPCIYKRISGCGSGTEYMAVTPSGDLYPCHQFVGEEKYKLGNLWDGVKNTEIQNEFKLCNAYARPECKDCWAKLYCSGGCAANAYHASGSVTGIYELGCKIFKKRIECAIWLEATKEN